MHDTESTKFWVIVRSLFATYKGFDIIMTHYGAVYNMITYHIQITSYKPHWLNFHDNIGMLVEYQW